MITKPCADAPLPANPRLRAGVEAERQMAFYLGRAFRDTPAVHVLHDLQIEDPAQPEFNGKPGRCQIDHLVLHTRGAFIIESKSVAGHVTIASDGTGGDLWTRSFQGRADGFPSPIKQAARQAEFLRSFLQRNRASLLGKLGLGMGLITKALHGTDQRGFSKMPLQVIVAISDNGAINFARGWQPPTEPFRVFVTKADQVTHKINDERTRHAAADGLLRQADGEYGFWSMADAEVARVAAFLHQSHAPITPGAAPALHAPPVYPAPAVPAAAPAVPRAATGALATCKSCGSSSLAAHSGMYGYYWKCANCSTNTRMPTDCSSCGARSERVKTVAIRKRGPEYYRCCAACGHDELIWRDRT